MAVGTVNYMLGYSVVIVLYRMLGNREDMAVCARRCFVLFVIPTSRTVIGYYCLFLRLLSAFPFVFLRVFVNISVCVSETFVSISVCVSETSVSISVCVSETFVNISVCVSETSVNISVCVSRVLSSA